MQEDSNYPSTSDPECYVIVHNVAKKHNIGTLARSATAFNVAKGTGLSAAQLKLCDTFVYIPQHGQGTASLNVTVATSIVLHHFAIWAGYQESSRHGFKFDVAAPPQRTAPRGQTVQKLAAYNLSCVCCSNQGSCFRACRKEVLMLHFFHAMFCQVLIQSSTLHALLTEIHM
ncbi:TPA: hypothetical protein ACH3X2_011956 [Trebouxia sp. C0005]